MLRAPRAWLAVAMACCCVVLVAPAGVRAEPIPIPGIRVTGGAVFHVDPDRDAVGALDVLPNLLIIDTDGGPYMSLLVGYGFEGGGKNTHLFQIGADVGLLAHLHFGATLGLRGVLGSAEGSFGGGLRTVLGADLWYGVFRIETGYQLLANGDGTEHDLRVMAGVDFIRLLIAPVILLTTDAFGD